MQRRRDPIKIALKKWWLRTGQHGKTGRSLNLDNRSLNLENRNQAFEGAAKEYMGESIASEKDAPYVENDDPTKARIRMPRRIGRLERWLRHMKIFWKPPMTPDEKNDLEVKNRQRAINRRMEIECRKLNKLVPNSYASMGIEYVRDRIKSKHEREKIQRVEFSKWVWTMDGATCYGKVRNIPYGHRPDELVDSRTLSGLSFSVEHPCGGRCDDRGGGTIISVSLAGSLDLPDWVDFDYAFPLIAESQPPLSVFLGIGENGLKHVINLEEAPHVLIGGSTGTGKSVCLTGIIATLVARNSPRDVRLLLADLKEMDLSLFRGCPHLLTEIEGINDGIVRKEIQIIPAIRWLQQENNRRQAMFGNLQIRNLAEWNRRHRNRYLPRIIFGVDEFARLMRTEYLKKEFISLVYDVASTSRATGIYIYAATQYCKDRYISTDIKMNLNGRIAFSTSDLPGSVALLDSGQAVGLYPPPGRGIFQLGQTNFKFQGCFISTKQILSIVKSAQQGKTLREIPADTGLTEEEICRWSLDENNGYLQTANTFNHFTPRIEAGNLKKLLQEMDNKIFTIDAIDYRVVPAAGARGRKLVRAEPEQETEEVT